MQYISALPATAPSWPRRLAVMGSTGSIGQNTLRIADAWPDKFRMTALAGGRNIALLAEQALHWRPPYLAVQDADEPECGADALKDALKKLMPSDYRPTILSGPSGFEALAQLDDVDMVVSAQVGAAGLRATAAAAGAGKMIALANKESLVLAGPLLRELCARTGAVLLPVDSEHGALFQCLMGRANGDVARLILTASGGPFRGKDAAFLKNVRPEDALRHPNWTMGAKITIDSATLMNKGLELIEACHLYGMPVERVGVVVHPQSIVHSLIELRDGSMLAQLASPDMRLPIAACLSWPDMLDNRCIAPLNLAEAGSLTFEEPDTRAFPCLDLAKRAFAADQTVELNAANEVAVARFLAYDIGFTDIPALVAAMLDQTPRKPEARTPDLETALQRLEARDAATRNLALAWSA